MILVFGGTGFIGRNLAIALHQAGERMLSVSRRPDRAFLSAHAPSAEAMTLEQFHADPATALFGCRAVIYLAGASIPASNLQTPWQELPDNVEPFLRSLSAIQLHSPEAHVVYASSGGTVYGRSAAAKIAEDQPLRPISAYGMGKKMMETALTFFCDQKGMRATILRPANPVGPWQTSRSQGVVGVLMRAAAQGTPFPMLGDGSTVRDYFDVADLVSALRAVIDTPEQSVGEIFNAGSGQGHSLRDMITLVEEVSGQAITIEQVPARSSDVDRVVLDITRARTQLGWEPQVPIHTSLTNIWRGYADNAAQGKP